MNRWLISAALLACLGMTSIGNSVARADQGASGQNEVRVRAALAGPAINRIVPEGHTEARIRGTHRQLNVEAEQVNLPDGTILSVNVNGASVGMIRLASRRGEMELNTNDGASVPVIHKGDVVTVTAANGAVIESGTF